MLSLAAKNHRRLVLICIVWIYVATSLRGVRGPNVWAQTYWLMSYDFGFIKRGFVGSLFQPIILWRGSDQHAETAILILSGALFLAYGIVLLRVCTRVLENSGYAALAALGLAVFVSSPYVVMSANVVGYFDHWIGLSLIASVMLWLRRHHWLAAFVLTICVLIHESIVLIGLPVVCCLALLLRTDSNGGRSPVLARLAPLALPVVTFLFVYLYQAFWLDARVVDGRLLEHVSEVGFLKSAVGAKTVVTTNSNPFANYLVGQSPRFFSRLADATQVMSTLPSVVVLLGTVAALCSERVFRRRAVVASAAATVVPLAILAVAWDTSRIWTYPILVAWGCAWLVSELRAANQSEPSGLSGVPRKPTAASPRTGEGLEGGSTRAFELLCAASLLVLVLNVVRDAPLMVGEVERFGVWQRIACNFLPVAFLTHYWLGERRAGAVQPEG